MEEGAGGVRGVKGGRIAGGGVEGSEKRLRLVSFGGPELLLLLLPKLLVLVLLLSKLKVLLMGEARLEESVLTVFWRDELERLANKLLFLFGEEGFKSSFKERE